MKVKDYYEILGVEKFSPKEQIKRSFQRLVLNHHPDKAGHHLQQHGTESETFTSALRHAQDKDALICSILEAWAVLGDETRRQAYDTELTEEVARRIELGNKYSWEVTTTADGSSGVVKRVAECPQCGNVNEVEEGWERVECDCCSTIMDIQ